MMNMSEVPSRGIDYRQASVACTDRGAHGRITLGKLTQMRSDGGVSYVGQGLDARHPGTGVLGTLSMRCPKCRREAQLKAVNARKLVDYLYVTDVRADDRMPTFDISRI